jgi:hypothetical protein
MSYLFPRRVLRAEDVLDPIELTQDISPAAERLSGRLNAHNFKQTISSTVQVDEEAFYKTYDYDHGVPYIWSGSSPNWLSPDDGFLAGGAYLVQNNFEWNVILEGPYGVPNTPAAVTVPTGASVLWVHAYAQYLWFGFDRDSSPTAVTPLAQHLNGAMYDPANIQFAIRVDGSIIPETITGIDDLTYRPSVPIKPQVQRNTGSILPGPADIRGEQTTALGPPCVPVRISALVPVQPGTHTVELVVRRAPLINAASIKSYKRTDKVYVFSRQIAVMDLKSFPVDSVGAAEVSAPAWDEEDLITQAEIYSDRVQPIINGYNAIEDGHAQRGAFMHYHLPDTLLGSYYRERPFSAGPVTHNNIMPGQLSGTTTTTIYSGSPAVGWAPVSDGSALQIQNIPATTDRKLLVLANVQVRNVSGDVFRTAGDPGEAAPDIRSFALFHLMWKRSTTPTWTPLLKSSAMVNNFVWWPSNPAISPPEPAQAYGLEQIEIPLMAIIDVVAGDSVDIGVFCGTSGNDTEFQVRYGSLIVLALRA